MQRNFLFKNVRSLLKKNPSITGFEFANSVDIPYSTLCTIFYRHNTTFGDISSKVLKVPEAADGGETMDEAALSEGFTFIEVAGDESCAVAEPETQSNTQDTMSKFQSYAPTRDETKTSSQPALVPSASRQQPSLPSSKPYQPRRDYYQRNDDYYDNNRRDSYNRRYRSYRDSYAPRRDFDEQREFRPPTRYQDNGYQRTYRPWYQRRNNNYHQQNSNQIRFKSEIAGVEFSFASDNEHAKAVIIEIMTKVQEKCR